MTDTAQYADVVLPATTFLEHYDSAKAYGPMTMQLARPVIDASRRIAQQSDGLRGPAAARGTRTPPAIPPTTSKRCFRSSKACPRRTARSCAQQWTATPPFDGRPIQFVDVWPRTEDRKVHLFPEALDREAPLGLYGFQSDPAPRSSRWRSSHPRASGRSRSTLGELDRPQVRLDLHPEDAHPRGIADGDRIRIFNGLGEVRLHARVTPLVRRGTVSMPKGVWRRHTGNGLTSNALVPDTLTDLGGGACFNDARVQVEKLAME